MPKGVQGFQKGRKKTGGREKGEPLKSQLSGSSIDQMRKYGINVYKELARGLKALPVTARYQELRALLPYLIPKLKEIDPITTREEEQQEAPISTADLLEAMKKRGGQEEPIRPSAPEPSQLPPVETRSADPQAEACSTQDLRDLAQIEGEN